MSTLINNAPRVIYLNGSPERTGFRFDPGQKRKLDEVNAKGEVMFDVLTRPDQLAYVRALVAKGDMLDADDVFAGEGEMPNTPKSKRPDVPRTTKARAPKTDAPTPDPVDDTATA